MATEAARVRPGMPGDVQSLAGIEQAATRHPWSLSQFLNSSLSERDHSLVLELASGELAGFAIYQQVLDEVTLLNIAVHPDLQGRGLGARLLLATLEVAKAGGARRCLLEVRRSNREAIALYRRQGFLDDGVRTDYYPTATGREDALLMSRQLAGA